MFPPPFSNDSILTGDLNPLTQAYHDVGIYGDADADDVLYEGPVVVHANGWLELEGNRFLSPSAVHHVDIYDVETEPRKGGDDGTDRDDDGGDRDEWGSDDDRRTGRFSPRQRTPPPRVDRGSSPR
ncbi:hypothetical protein [Natronococcus wangiae]|uniref:hypothetical protein n=1 Tax=Natronococcus wangiae TaxID=3068275 RepID=UPI00273F677B|nr:hypothetical protein [Natronococcus sp. AD5]